MQYDKVYVSNVSKLGIAQQCNKTGCTSTMFQDWELLSNVTRFDLPQQCVRIRYRPAMY